MITALVAVATLVFCAGTAGATAPCTTTTTIPALSTTVAPTTTVAPVTTTTVMTPAPTTTVAVPAPTTTVGAPVPTTVEVNVGTPAFQERPAPAANASQAPPATPVVTTIHFAG